MNANRRLVFAALVGAGVLWGSTVPLSKVALGWLPPAWLAFARFALAAAILLVAGRSRLRAAFSPAIMINGAVGYGGSVLLQNLGIERTSVTHAALLIGATPVLIAVTAAVLRHSVARPLAWAGFTLSLAGVGFIAGGQGSGSSLAGDGLVLAAQFCSAGYTVFQARILRAQDPIAVSGIQLMSAAVCVLPIALFTEHHTAGAGGLAALLATIGLVIAGTVLPTALFAFGQSRVSADVAGAFLNLEPLVGAFMGIALFAEPAGPVQLAGGAAISVGIGLSSFQVARGERSASATAARASTGPASASAPNASAPNASGPNASGPNASAPGAEAAAGGAIDRAPQWSGAPPGEAPSVVKRAKRQRAKATGSARPRRRVVRSAGPRAGRPSARSRRARRHSRFG